MVIKYPVKGAASWWTWGISQALDRRFFFSPIPLPPRTLMVFCNLLFCPEKPVTLFFCFLLIVCFVCFYKRTASTKKKWLNKNRTFFYLNILVCCRCRLRAVIIHEKFLAPYRLFNVSILIIPRSFFLFFHQFHSSFTCYILGPSVHSLHHHHHHHLKSLNELNIISLSPWKRISFT